MTTFKEYCQLAESYSKEPNSKLGTNPGGVYTHEPSKQKFYIKFPHNPEQSHVEAATAELYGHMGVPTLEPKTKEIDGKTGIASKWNPDLEILGHPDNVENRHHYDLALMHHAAVVTGNLDIVGMEYDNIVKNKKTGDLMSVDQGGAMHFRAMGDKKDFGPSITKEIQGFQNPAYQSGRVFSKIPHETFKAASKHLDKLTDEKIDATMKAHGLEHLAGVIKTRRDLLKRHYD
jgi:hypothetical protein